MSIKSGKIPENTVSSENSSHSETVSGCLDPEKGEVAVCVYCESQGVGGVAVIREADSADPGAVQRAIDSLVRRLREGIPEAPFKAKLAGSAHRIADLARGQLEKAGIPIAGTDLGGGCEREYVFYPASGRLRVARCEPRLQAIREYVTGSREKKPRRKRVLVVDDSRTIRDLLSRVLAEDPGLEIIGAAASAREAEELIERNDEAARPDVVTLDIHMPEMDGIAFLSKLMATRPLPVVMVSSLSMEEGPEVLKALELGAVDYIQKPSLASLDSFAATIREKVRTAADVNAEIVRQLGAVKKTATQTTLAPVHRLDPSILVAIGASTGGTEALREVLTRLPDGIPPIVVVQHIPALFSRALADRLDSLCQFPVREAQDGDPVAPNQVLIAPGGKQMVLQKAGDSFTVRVSDDPPVNRHRPSVDYLFDSIAGLAGRSAIGVILTGMGADGARGLLKMRQAGARTIAQDEQSSVVFGMPKEAIRLGAAEEVRPLDRIAETLVDWLHI